MISVEEAKNIINSQKPNWGDRKVLLAESMGEVLAEDISADRDFPPFDRVTMDGIALSYESFHQGQREFKVQEIQLAGEPAVALKNPDYAIEIMTGAMLSKGCDLVIRYEDLEFFEEGNQKNVRIILDSAERWKNVHKQGSDLGAGELLIPEGQLITAAEVAIMATVGCDVVKVQSKPNVAIVSTGDELVDVREKPLPHQIRKSNAVAIEASLNQLRIPNKRFHLVDDKKELKEKIRTILDEFDLVLMSGGVSKGKADYLPEVLEELKVEKLFHRVAQRPGKPFWFGVNEVGKQVFAFPGNPISTYMCFRVYFMPWLMKNLKREIPMKVAILQEDVSFKPDLGYFLQIRSEISVQGHIDAFPEMGNGSGDLANLAKSDAFLYLPPGQNLYKARKSYEYYSFDISSLA
ncbi:molybdopterin molybdochelatase [Reichenbachiella faecimaris]|uniref:Molybdopterin molybdenumtransferase n=1 Tax=Reichenbachiella faecimaris TaxID=692418 RepID=A0A1W2G7Q1_REIFA|nr:molybdopterin molybdotransferase MoeA [Reichenbachiella faecimaris]SMD32697.1 molybdopterin molybdochelatase [Reichenbachiella faecimaris]